MRGFVKSAPAKIELGGVQHDKKGHFTEVLRVRDDKGNVGYHISIAYVVNTSDLGISRMWMTYYPSLDVKAGDEIRGRDALP